MLLLVQAAVSFVPHGAIQRQNTPTNDVRMMARTVDGAFLEVSPGDRLPELEVQVNLSEEKSEFKSIGDVLGKSKSILLGMSGAFTPTCTDVHLPGFYAAAEQLKENGYNVPLEHFPGRS